MTTHTIRRILSVVDTREYEEQGDRWVPIPGSGEVNECSRCGREHEVHATVELEDGSTVVVGTGCMKGESVPDREIERLSRAAMRSKRAAAELRALEATVAAWEAAESAARATPFPPVTVRSDPYTNGGKTSPRLVFCMGEHQAWCWTDQPSREDVEERTLCLQGGVVADRLRAAGFGSSHPDTGAYRRRALRAAIAKNRGTA